MDEDAADSRDAIPTGRRFETVAALNAAERDIKYPAVAIPYNVRPVEPIYLGSEAELDKVKELFSEKPGVIVYIRSRE